MEHLFTLLDTFESRAQEIRNERAERAQVFFRAVEDLENSWYSAVDELAQSLVEKLNSDLLEDVTDEVSTLLSDRDSLIVAVQGSHDIHLGKPTLTTTLTLTLNDVHVGNLFAQEDLPPSALPPPLEP